MTLLNPGYYKARGIEAALAATSKGDPQVAVLIEILDGEHAGERRTWFGHFTEKTQDKTLEQLRTLGWSTDDLTDLRGIGDNEVSIKVEHETDQNGETRDRIRWINAPGGGGLAIKERMDDAAARAFAARMKGAAIASRNKSKGATGIANVQIPAARPPARTPMRNGGPSPEELAGAFDDDPMPF